LGMYLLEVPYKLKDRNADIVIMGDEKCVIIKEKVEIIEHMFYN